MVRSETQMKLAASFAAQAELATWNAATWRQQLRLSRIAVSLRLRCCAFRLSNIGQYAHTTRLGDWISNWYGGSHRAWIGIHGASDC